jgi:hypothetical protein
LAFVLSLPFLLIQDQPSFAASPATLRKGPYLLFNGDSFSMTVVWQTNKTPAQARVEWGTSPSHYSNSSGELSETEDHQFFYRIAGLGPHARFYYRVSVDNTQTMGTFATAPTLTAAKLTFYGYGDTRGGLDLLADSQYVVHSYVEREIMKDVNRDIGARQTFALHLGDFVTCGLDEAYWDQQYFNKNLLYTQEFLTNLPVLGTIGNHESLLPGHTSGTSSNCQPLKSGQVPNCDFSDSAKAGELFYKYFPYPFYPSPKGSGAYRDYYFYFDYGPARFLALDCITSSLDVDGAQCRWLSNSLAPFRLWNIISIHVPLWSSKNNHSRTQTQGLRESLQPLFEAKNVPLVIQGHEHYYSRCLVNGITYLTIGGGGAQLYDPAPIDPDALPFVVSEAKFYHFARFEISGSGMTVTVFDRDGLVVDFFKIITPPFNLSPADGTPTSLAPTLISSPFLSQDGAKHVSSQWIIREGSSGKIVFITNRNGVPVFEGDNLTVFTVPSNILRPLHRYNWQVIYKDSNGNTTRPSLATTFYAGEIYIFDFAKLTLGSAFRY